MNFNIQYEYMLYGKDILFCNFEDMLSKIFLSTFY